MIKLVGPMTRLDQMSREDFRTYYVERHTKAASGLPGNIKYVASPALQSANGDDPAFDAVAELYWHDLDTLRSAYTDETWERPRQDHLSVVSGRLMFVTEEITLREPPPPGSGPVKYLAFLSRKDGMSRERFRSYWLGTHAELALDTPGLLGYRACPAICSANGDGLLTDPPEPAQFDGVAEMWFDSLEAFRASFADPYWDKLRSDYYLGFAMGRLQVLVQEHLVFDQTASA
jgi:uncharacterized protein (TIGR02118 family)